MQRVQLLLTTFSEGNQLPGPITVPFSRHSGTLCMTSLCHLLRQRHVPSLAVVRLPHDTNSHPTGEDSAQPLFA